MTRTNRECITFFLTKEWRLGVSIPLPLACEASALPYELNPQASNRIPVYRSPWRNGSALDSRPKGWGFKSLWALTEFFGGVPLPKSSEAGNRTRVICVTGRYTEPLYYFGWLMSPFDVNNALMAEWLRRWI